MCGIRWWFSLVLFLLFKTGNPVWKQSWSKKIIIISLSQKLLPRLIQICRIQFWCWVFLLLTKITLSGRTWSKNSKLFCSEWNLIPKLIRIFIIQWWYSFYLFKTGNTLFRKICQKIKIVSFSWNLVLRLIRLWTTQWWYSSFFWFRLEVYFLWNLFQKTKIAEGKI